MAGDSYPSPVCEAAGRAAAVSKVSRAIAVVVSESTGTVRIFQDGEVMLRIEPLRRPMKWHEFEYEAPPD